MIGKFLTWLEDSVYAAVVRGVARAVADLSGGQITLEEPPAIEQPAKRGRKAKA